MKARNLWLPMSLIIFIVYAIQRGMGTLMKSDMAPAFMPEAMSIYFYVVAFGIIAAGILLDRLPTPVVMAAATGLGTLGLCMATESAWGFALLFGSAAAVMKIAPFSGPLKINPPTAHRRYALKIVPQSMAKNIGKAAFLLGAGSSMLLFGWGHVMYGLAVIFCIAGSWAVVKTPVRLLPYWKWSIFKNLSKDPIFWLMMVYFMALNAVWWVTIGDLFPAVKALGYTNQETLWFFVLASLVPAALRWPCAWLGVKYGHPYVFVTGVVLSALSLALLRAGMPMQAFWLFVVSGAAASPTYWPYLVERWGAGYVATVAALANIAMYLGAGFAVGRW